LLVAVAVALVVGASSVLAAPPEAPKVSTFAPAEDLAKQVDRYVEDLEKAVENQGDFDEAKVTKLSNTLMLMAIGLGLHDTDNQYKANAGAIFKAAEDLSKAKGFDAAKAGVAAVKAAVGGKGTAGQVSWAQGAGANLDAVYKQAQTVVNSLKRYTKSERFKKSAKETAGFSAVLAVMGQGVMASTSHAKGDDQVQQWYKFSAEMRDAAAETNKAIHAGDAEATQAAVKKLNKSCEDCHAVFHKEEK
jgi:cytochrome c556